MNFYYTRSSGTALSKYSLNYSYRFAKSLFGMGRDFGNYKMGIDLGFINDRVLLNATYARNRSSNQLLMYSLPGITGFSGVTTNFPALVQNTSWELTLSTQNLNLKSFKWSSNINVTLPGNKLVSFPKPCHFQLFQK